MTLCQMSLVVSLPINPSCKSRRKYYQEKKISDELPKLLKQFIQKTVALLELVFVNLLMSRIHAKWKRESLDRI